MLSRSEILEALQFEFIHNLDAINTGAGARYTLTYQFAGATAPADLPTLSTFTGWTAFTEAEKTAFRGVLAEFEKVLNIDFVEVAGSGDPDINVGKVDLPGPTAGMGGPSAGFIGSHVTSFDGFVVLDNADIDLTSEDAQSLMFHELGHALGLKHTFHEGHVNNGDDHALPTELDNNKFSVMSYSANPDTAQFADGLQLFDVFALQDIWGRAAHNTSGDTYSGSRTDTTDVIWDTRGRDTFDASAKSGKVMLDLRQGKFSTFDSKDDVAIAFGTKIENALGGSNKDRLVGNVLNNDMRGGAGGDVLNGLQGNDKLRGEDGADRLFGHNGDDLLAGGLGRDRLEGGRGDDRLFGGLGADTFVYKARSNADEIRDFQNDRDSLLFIGHGTKQDVMARATDVGSDVVFDFGNGHSVTVLNMSVATITDDVLV